MTKTEYAERHLIKSVEIETFEDVESENLYIMNSNYYYVYEHYLDGNVIYVGKGKGYRAYSNSRNLYWELTVGDRSHEVEVKIIGVFRVEDDAFLFEELLIRKRANEGYKLCNVVHNDKVHENFDKNEVDLIREKRENKMNLRNALNKSEQAKKKAMKETLGENSLNLQNDRRLLLSISKDFINKPLSASDKVDLCMTIGLRNKNGRVYKWRTISKLFLEQGFTIKDETIRINNKRVRVSTIISTMDTIEDTQNSGEMRNDVELPAHKANKKKVMLNVPNEYIGKRLTVSNKNKLCEEIGLKNRNGRLYKWRTISRLLSEQGFSIINETVKIDNKYASVSTIMNVMETTEQTQTVGEIRSSMDILVCGDDKKEVFINVPDEYIGKQLTASNKSKLCEEIDLKNKNGRLYKWRTISKLLLKQGFIIKDEIIKVDNKRVRVSTINRR